MPKTVGVLVILLLAVIPGFPGERAYASFVGLDWREDRIWRLVRILLFSVAGLVLYIAVAALMSLPLPFYVVPQRVTALVVNDLPSAAAVFTGHALCAFLVGIGTAFSERKLAEWTGSTTHVDVWDDFVNGFAPDHWVIVKLANGRTFAGILEGADTEARREERDIILTEPALYDEEKQAFISEQYQHLYLPAALISSIAVYHDPEQDSRITPVNQPLFTDE